MTREEVMIMTDEELRIKAAELAGWESVKFAPEYGDLWGNCPENDEGNGDGWDVIPYYPNEIAAAWELWEKLPSNRSMSEDSLWIEISCGPTLDRIDDTFLRISRRDEFDHPRAITRAFLLARSALVAAPSS